MNTGRSPESHRFLAKVPAPRRRVRSVPAFRKMRVQRQLVPSRTSAGLCEQKANQAVGNLYLHSRIEAAICATCWSLCVRAFLA
jgi:hypothetical protein